MMVSRRASLVAVGLFASLCLLVGLYSVAPDGVVEKARVQLQGARVMLGENAVAAQLELSAHCTSMVQAFGAHSAVAQVKLQALGNSMVQTLSEQSAVAQVKLQALRDSEFPRLYASGQNATHAIGARVYQSAEDIKEWFRNLEAEQLPRQLHSTVLSTVRILLNRVPVDVAGFKAGAVAVMARCQIATSMEVSCFAFGLILVVWQCFATWWNRTLPATQMIVAPQADPVLAALTPLGERQVVQPRLQRRRSESPGAVGPKNTAVTQDENAHPNAAVEQDLLSKLNRATGDELRSVAGLGDKSIVKLLSYRKRKGDLESVDDLVTKVGIHRATFANFSKAHAIY